MVKSKSFAHMDCSIARALEQVGSWWSLLIIRDAFMGATRFNHFEKSLGIAKNTLVTRLADLTRAGILERVAAADGAAFDEFHLTDQGRDLAPILIALSQWGDKWFPHSDGPSTEIVLVNSGHPIQTIWPRDEGGGELSLDDIGFRRRPGIAPLAWEGGDN